MRQRSSSLSGWTSLLVCLSLIVSGLAFSAGALSGRLPAQLPGCWHSLRCSVASVELLINGHPGSVVVARPVRVAGSLARPLAPGAGGPLDLRLTNRNAAPVVVTGLRVRLATITAPAASSSRPCTAADFRIRQSRFLRVVVPAQETTSLRQAGVSVSQWPRVRMVNRPVNQDGCKGATLLLRYTVAAPGAHIG